MADEGHDLDRRTVLRSIAVGSALAASAGAAAGDRGAPADSVTARRLALEQRFGDPGTVRRVVAAEAGPVAEALADLGYLESATVDDVAVDAVLRKPDYRATDAAGVATVGPGRVGDVPGAVVNVRQRVDGHEIEYYLHPDHDRDGYAIVSELDGGRSVLVEPGAGPRDVETESCGSCPTGCSCDTKCDWQDLCDCVVGGYKWYQRLHEDCVQFDNGDCGCTWCDGACDCQGEETSACPS